MELFILKWRKTTKNSNSTIALTLFQVWYQIFHANCYKQKQAVYESVEYFPNLVICLSQLPQHSHMAWWRWPFVWGIHRSPVNSLHKGQWRGALMFSLICVWINGWENNREAGDLRRYRAHYDVIVMDGPRHQEPVYACNEKGTSLPGCAWNVRHSLCHIDMGLMPDTWNCGGCACTGNAGNVSPPRRVSDPDMHHGTCVAHVPWCMPGSLSSCLI